MFCNINGLQVHKPRVLHFRMDSHHEFLVITDGAKDGVMEHVPGNVLHHSCVSSEDVLSIQCLGLLTGRPDIPQADSLRRNVSEAYSGMCPHWSILTTSRQKQPPLRT